MKTNQTVSILLPASNQQIPQLKIRSGLRIGADLAACEKSLEDWKQNYYKWYEAAKYKSV